MRSYKSFSIIFFIVIFITLGPLAFFNYYIDPLWTFNHANLSNNVQTVIDERQQKMNDIHYSDFDYDTLLIGSSRSTYINQHDFQNMDVYNFAASDLSITEYKDMLDFAKKENGQDFERVIIGVDFFKSSKEQSNKDLTLDKYINNINEPFYRWKNLLSIDVFNYAKKNYELSKTDNVKELRTYNRKNVASARSFDDEIRLKQTKEKIEKFRREFYGDQFQYNPKFKQILKELKAENPDTEFIIFTTPISAPLFQAMKEKGNFDEYQRWLKDIISVFDGVYNFMYPNSVTSDLSNYFDGHHFYPDVGTLIAKKISVGADAQVPEDFGTYVTKNNYDEHLKEIAD